MARQKRSFRWLLFFTAVACFLYTVLIRVSWWAVALFFLSGAGWYWLEQRITRELDALPPGSGPGDDESGPK